MRTWLRTLWGKNYVKITRLVGEEERVEVSFNENDGAHAIKRTNEWIEFFNKRRADHNRAVVTEINKRNQG